MKFKIKFSENYLTYKGPQQNGGAFLNFTTGNAEEKYWDDKWNWFGMNKSGSFADAFSLTNPAMAATAGIGFLASNVISDYQKSREDKKNWNRAWDELAETRKETTQQYNTTMADTVGQIGNAGTMFDVASRDKEGFYQNQGANLTNMANNLSQNYRKDLAQLDQLQMQLRLSKPKSWSFGESLLGATANILGLGGAVTDLYSGSKGYKETK